jgi:hypothetical protein
MEIKKFKRSLKTILDFGTVSFPVKEEIKEWYYTLEVTKTISSIGSVIYVIGPPYKEFKTFNEMFEELVPRLTNLGYVYNIAKKEGKIIIEDDDVADKVMKITYNFLKNTKPKTIFDIDFSRLIKLINKGI